MIVDTNFQPIISTNTRGHYRQHSLEFKRALVALSLEPGVFVAGIARTRRSAGAASINKDASACLR